MKRKRFSVDTYVEGVLNCNRTILAQTITLIESRNADDRILADLVLNKLLPKSGNSFRIGITGVPGAGKSTFINQFGKNLCQKKQKVAVLTIDPSSIKSGGSILGDKTRMFDLSQEVNCFIRPSPTSGMLGGVNRYTREAILICEAAGYDIIIVETVGVGQNELTIESITDLTLLLTITGAGDDLQSIKKGIIEIADIIAINKADGNNKLKAEQYALELKHVLHTSTASQIENIFCCSSIENEGFDHIWECLEKIKTECISNGNFKAKRDQQLLEWMQSEIIENLKEIFFNNPDIKAVIEENKNRLIEHKITVPTIVSNLMEQFLKSSQMEIK